MTPSDTKLPKAANKVAAASRRCSEPEITFTPQSRPISATITTASYFDPEASIEFLRGDLPHWRQEGVTYFVTFRLADSLPQEKLSLWQKERTQWLDTHPGPHNLADRADYYARFPQRLQQWLDAGTGSCILAHPEARLIVENAIRFFHGQRYHLDESVVAPNHVHLILAPMPGFDLSSILHSWKSYTSHELPKLPQVAKAMRVNKVEKVAAASRRCSLTLWQKESFDHIVRSEASLKKFRKYIQDHNAPANGAAASRR